VSTMTPRDVAEWTEAAERQEESGAQG